MTIIKELSLVDFDFWSGAKDHYFTCTELKELEYHLYEVLNDPTETDINDLFWFEEQFLCDMIGVDFEEDYLNR